MNAENQRDLELSVLKKSDWIYRGKSISLRVDSFELNGKKKTTELIDHPGAVVILAINDKKEILLIRQWRRALGKIILELPAGTLEKGELPLDCAQRELQEETGFRAGKITSMGGFYCAPGFCNEYLHLFFAQNLDNNPLPQDDDEGIDLVPTSLESALELIEQGVIMDAKSIIGVLKCVKLLT